MRRMLHAGAPASWWFFCGSILPSTEGRDYAVRSWNVPKPIPTLIGQVSWRRKFRGSGLLAEIEFLDELLIALGSSLLEIIKKTAALGDHPEKTATRGMILGVGLEMVGQGADPLGEAGDLDIGAAGVVIMQPDCCDFCGLCHVFI